jgi:hypothetical protein
MINGKIRSMNLSQHQRDLIDYPIASHIFLEGPAGAGKTTAAVSRMLRLLDGGIPGSSLLVLLPQRTYGTPYQNALRRYETAPGGVVSVLTMGGLAQRMLELFWPMITKQAGFTQPNSPPTFLTLETAQYYMAKLVSPLLEQGYFESVVMDRNRLFSQILDNLNKAAVVGFPYTEIGERLKDAWSGSPAQLRIYDDTQTCATLFRKTCLENNLLDFSLQVEVFWKHVWELEPCRNYLIHNYRHIIFDNIEEETPFAHNIITQWVPELDSALLIFDENAGYRRFLGADPDGASLIKDLCTTHQTFPAAHVMSPPIAALIKSIDQTIFNQPDSPSIADPRPALEYHTSRFYPQMVDWVADNVATLVHEHGINPSEIVVLAPYLSDALRYGIMQRLEQRSVPVRSHRPSRSLREEPVTYALLTLAKLAHPQWDLGITKSDLAYTLLQTIERLDLVRSHLLTDIIFRPRSGSLALESFNQIIPSTQDRITFLVGEQYEILRSWLITYREYPPLELDHFFATIFGEVLSQPGFHFHTNYDAGSVAARLIGSVQKFRRITSSALAEESIPPGKEYIRMIEQGVIAAQYLESWQPQIANCVLAAPAYTYLISNYPVTVQFWLDVNSRSWAERLSQPLTNPYVLSRTWLRDKIWTDSDEVKTNQDALHRLITGLLHRCRWKIYLGMSELGEQGFEQRGPLIRIINQVLQQYAAQ